MKQYQAYIFDLDGTLVDSALDFNAIRRDLGIELDAPILEAIEDWEPVRKKRALEIIHQHENKGAEASVMIPGVLDFLKVLKEQNKPTAVFTRNSKKVTELTLKKHALEFSMVVTRDDAPAKPDPSGLHAIAKNWNLKNSEILYVGDYHYDLLAGRAAQMPTALYLNTPADFDTSGAIWSFVDYQELIQRVL